MEIEITLDFFNLNKNVGGGPTTNFEVKLKIEMLPREQNPDLKVLIQPYVFLKSLSVFVIHIL